LVSYSRGSGNYKSSNVIVRRKTSSQSVTSSETLVDETDMQVTLAPSRFYCGSYHLLIKAGATGKLDITLDDITGATLDVFNIGSGGSAPRNMFAFGAEHSITTDGTDEAILIYFWFRTGSAGGILKMRFAQNVSDATDSTIQIGSMLVLYDGGK